VAGCADVRTEPVSGKITYNNEPLTAQSTIILFKPDRSKGNESPLEPIGTVDGSGNYTVKTNGRAGAPPGWYKVVVTATKGTPEHPKGTSAHRPVAESLLPAKYGLETSTDLAVEVVASPASGAYDLKLNQ
jgi:hypothetical protein